MNRDPEHLVTMSEILETRDQAPDKNAILLDAVPVIEKIRFSNGEIEFRGETTTNTRMILINPGDLVLSGINAIRGAIAVYPESASKPCAATIHYSSYKVNRQRVTPRYLWWYLRSPAFRSAIAAQMPNGIKTELKPGRLLGIKIPVPPLQAQREIAQTLDLAFQKLEYIHQLRNVSIGLFNSLFESYIGSGIGGNDELGVFSDVVTFKPRSGPSFPTRPDASGIPILMPSSVTGFGVDPTRVEFSVDPAPHFTEKDLLLPGDILIARGNKRDQVGNAGVVPTGCEGWTYANLLMRIRVNTALVDPDFCVYWFRTPYMRALVRSQMSGTNPNIQKINQKKILHFPFPTGIPLGEQRRIVQFLRVLECRFEHLRGVLQNVNMGLEAIVPSILDRIFNGEL